MRRVELQIAQCRRATENTEFTENSGLSDEEFIEYLNNGQDELQSAISLVHPSVFQAEVLITTVSGQEAYTLPESLYLGSRIEFVEFSHSGSPQDYHQLRQGMLPERLSGVIHVDTSFYIRRNNQILLQPAPHTSNGIIRVTFQKKLPKMDKRRAKVSAVTLDSLNNTIVSLTFDTTSDIDKTALEEENFMSIVDKNGVLKMAMIPVLDVNMSTGVVTLDTFNYETGETIDVGDYAVRGKFTVNTALLDDTCERYLINYCNWKILKRDSSNDSGEAAQELQLLQQSIVDSYKEADSDVDYVPILDDQYLLYR